MSEDEEAVATFPTELQKLNRVWYYPQFQALHGGVWNISPIEYHKYLKNINLEDRYGSQMNILCNYER